MKQPAQIQDVVAQLRGYEGEPLRFMEICGTHTSSIFRHGIRDLVSSQIRLIAGPGCPVCVTPALYIDRVLTWAKKPGCVVLSFGDMLKVPGSKGESLSLAQASGAQVEIIYGPHEVLEKAQNHPDRVFVLAAVGFETTIPAYALLLDEVRRLNLKNIKLVTALKRLMPALEFICQNETGISGFLAPGHVSAIIGSQVYAPLAKEYHKPFAVAGFSAEQILAAVYGLLRQVQNGKAEVHNYYRSAVKPEGNVKARRIIDRVFEPGTAAWRGLGDIEGSGYYLKEEYRDFDGGSFGIREDMTQPQNQGCRCAEVIIGRLNPDECPRFAKGCTPQNPQGPCMVSEEGSCGIWFRHQGRVQRVL
ncbi:MAG: hydrogenase formation protein HypD [Peptococcaceae bacterium]|nr:hydrogenase formation protein HypD [Peptococcaceae bacterium]